jgi:fermentation-respiration switch protein FrsA (DUF1100 family)
MTRAVVITAAILLLVLAIAAVLLAANEGRFIYFPLRPYDASPEQYGLQAESLDLTASDGIRLRGWWLRGRGRTVLVYFHGNGGNISHRLDRSRTLIEGLGLDVVLVDYRGYGRSDGQPSERGLYADGEAIYEGARARGFPPERIVLFGESLGCAVAIETALRKLAAALILEAPFLSVRRMARAVLPVVPPLLIRTRYDNEAKIGLIGIPKLIAGSDADDVVPFAQTRRLFERAAEPRAFYIVSGASHNNIYIVGGQKYLQAWKTFLEKAGLPAP